MKSASRLAAIALVLGLAGCGFRPLHAPPSAPPGAEARTPAIGSLTIDTIPGQTGHVLRRELSRLTQVERGRGAPRRLAVTLSEQIAGLGIRVDESASRSDVIVTANYVLYEPDGTVALRGAVTATAGYDIPIDAFGEIAAQDDARERAGELLAVLLRSDIALRLAQRARQASATTPPSP